MVFVCGGTCQGKTEWVAQRWSLKKDEIFDLGGLEEGCELNRLPNSLRAISHLERYVERNLPRDESLEGEILSFAESRSGLIIITDELGSGIIPTDRNMARLRERHGRICCRLAQNAEEVYRVICGIGMTLKQQEKYR